MKKNEFFVKNAIDSENYSNIIRLILKSGDQLFKCFNFNENGELIWLV